MVSVLITSGSTREYIDPIRFISSGASGKQGCALAECMGMVGLDVKLVTSQKPVGVDRCDTYQTYMVDTSSQMLDKCLALLPVDVAIFAAAVTDWLPNRHRAKIKKTERGSIDVLHSPDIVKCVCLGQRKPKLAIGFCLESENLISSAREKLYYKGCDWIIANHQYVTETEQVMGSDLNKISIVTKDSVRSFPVLSKREVALLLTEEIIDYLKRLDIP